MATTAKPVIQPRDRHLLSALYFSPLTIEQALSWSKCWSKPFTNWKKLYDRLEELRSADLIQRFRYALATSGASPSYYKLTKNGYRRLLNDDEATPPGRYSFSRISRNEELHTLALADFLVTTFRAAARFGCELLECYPDHTVALLGDADERPLYPDFLFTVTTSNKEQFHYCIELDRHTQSIRSTFNRDALEWKIRRYESYHYLSERLGHNFRVLFVTIGSQKHVENIVQAAKEIVIEPKREIFYAASLREYETSTNPFTKKIWMSQCHCKAALIPSYAKAARRSLKRKSFARSRRVA